MKAEPEYSGWLAILEPPPNLMAELQAKLPRAKTLPPLLLFGCAPVASGSGAVPRAAFEAAAAFARTHSEVLRFGPPAWRGRTLVLEPDAPTARLLRGLGACFPSDDDAEGPGGLEVGEARAEEEPDGDRHGNATLAFRAFRLSMWRSARVQAPADGWLLELASDAWIRTRDRPGRA